MAAARRGTRSLAALAVVAALGALAAVASCGEALATRDDLPARPDTDAADAAPDAVADASADDAASASCVAAPVVDQTAAAPEGQVDCGGAMVQLAVNDAHCGECFRKCRLGGCQQGMCPVATVTNEPGPRALARTLVFGDRGRRGRRYVGSGSQVLAVQK